MPKLHVLASHNKNQKIKYTLYVLNKTLPKCGITNKKQKKKTNKQTHNLKK